MTFQWAAWIAASPHRRVGSCRNARRIRAAEARSPRTPINPWQEEPTRCRYIPLTSHRGATARALCGMGVGRAGGVSQPGALLEACRCGKAAALPHLHTPGWRHPPSSPAAMDARSPPGAACSSARACSCGRARRAHGAGGAWAQRATPCRARAARRGSRPGPQHLFAPSPPPRRSTHLARALGGLRLSQQLLGVAPHRAQLLVVILSHWHRLGDLRRLVRGLCAVWSAGR